MRRILCILIGLCLTAAAPTRARPANQRHPLVKLDIQPVQGQKACGPYFIVADYGGGRSILFFHYESAKEVQDDAINLKNVKVEVPDKPVVEPPSVRFDEGENGRIALFLLSAEDRRAASCLPKPEPAAASK